MGLFDDLLKKPTPAPTNQGNPANGGGSSSGSQPSTDDSNVVVPVPKFVIEKSQETVIFGPDTENAKIAAQNVATAEQPVIPVEPTHYEETNSDSVIMNATPEVAPVMTTESTTNMIPVAEAVNPPTIDEPPTEPLVSNVKSPDDLNIESPQGVQIESSNTEAHIEEPMLINEPILAPVSNTDNFLASLTSNTETQEEEPIAEKPPMAEIIGFETPADSSVSPSEILAFSSPKEFIEHSLESIDTMIEKIDMKHEAKIEEAEGYGNEKDRYTELEKKAYAEAETMDKEKAHTLRMRKLLEKELVLEDATSLTLSRGGSLSKIRKASKKDADEVETLVGL